MGHERDRATALTLGWLALLLVAAWAVSGVVDGGVRLVDAWRWHDALRGVSHREPLVPAGAELVLSILWVAGLAALALGVAIGVTALAARGRGLRGFLFAVLAVAGVVVQLLCIRLTGEAARTFSTTGVPDTELYAAASALVVPAVLVTASWLVLSPTVRTPRSTPEPAAGG
jgi:hypothetical protein